MSDQHPSEAVFTIESGPDGRVTARNEEDGAVYRADSIGRLRTVLREAVLSKAAGSTAPKHIRLKRVVEWAFPVVPEAGPNAPIELPIRLKAGWIIWSICLLLSIPMVAGGCWLVSVAFREPRPNGEMLGWLGLTLVSWTLYWVLWNMWVRPSLTLDSGGITQLKPFGRDSSISWSEISFVAQGGPEGSWLILSDGGKQVILVPGSMSSSKLKAFGRVVLDMVPMDVWDQYPDVRNRLEQQISGSGPLLHRLVF